MSQVINILPSQGSKPVIKALEAVIDGLYHSHNHYDILATHTGARTGYERTQRHTLCKKDVSRVELYANHCEVIYKPSLRRTVLFLPYDAIKDIDHYKKVEPRNVRLFRAEHLKQQPYIYSSMGEYGTM